MIAYYYCCVRHRHHHHHYADAFERAPIGVVSSVHAWLLLLSRRRCRRRRRVDTRPESRDAIDESVAWAKIVVMPVKNKSGLFCTIQTYYGI